MASLVIENCAVATVDAIGTEYQQGHIVIDGSRILTVGEGPVRGHPEATHIDGHGCLATPGLVNTHHHLYQWATRGMAQDADLFTWLRELYPLWAGIKADFAHDVAAAGLAWLALSGCSTTADHRYLFPRDGSDVLAAEIDAARQIGLRFHPCRGSMDRGQSSGGLPPDDLVERVDDAVAATAEAIERYHDPAADAMVQIAVAPCSPFSVSDELLQRCAELARAHGVRLHTHIAETAAEDAYCQDMYGASPVEYLDGIGWLGPDVWLAHAVHVNEAEAALLARTGTAVAHCPSSNARLGTGSAPIRRYLDAGVAVGLGVDGPASQESGLMVEELRQALYVARLAGGPAALTAREALAMGTVGGARCLGRADELGSLEPGKLADLALWRIDDLGHVGMADPVAALVLGPPAAVELLVVNGRVVVAGGELRTADVGELSRTLARAAVRVAASQQ